ncbi:MAG: N-acetylmuramoyl-L-alanine amidase [Oscillospiraceae bacterium]|nr:N-acetylmuramoyl-L-alanine amidase [Oscillospiraceae bacterium]
MKKVISLFFAFVAVFILSTTAFAAEAFPRLFYVDDKAFPEEVCSFAAEKGFGGILLDLRKSDSAELYSEYTNASGLENFEVYAFIDESHLEGIKPGSNLVFSEGISEEAISEYSSASGSGFVSFYLSFEDEKSFEAAKYFYEKGYFKTLFVENLYSCYSESGYEQYLLDVVSEFPDAKIITINDIKRVLAPVAKGDFYGDAFEINNQYLVNKINGFGFCVLDYFEISENKNISVSSLLSYMSSNILDEHADFSVSREFEITRPTTSVLSVETEKYTIFGTSDPKKPLYMNGSEVERISSSGLFAATVNVPKKGKTYTFSQGGKSLSVTLKRGVSNIGTGTTKKLTSCAPASDIPAQSGETTVTLSCIGPSGGYVTAKIGEKTYILEQVAYADSGVPARFSKTVEIPAEYPENSVSEIGKVTYFLTYNGKNTQYESAGAYYYIGKNASLAVKASLELSGVERNPGDSGDYITTLRTGCSDYVTEIAENGWYKLSCGGFIKPSQCEIITGETDITCSIFSSSKEIGENFEKLNINSSSIPAFKGEIKGKALVLTLFNTEWSDLSGIDTDSDLMRRIVAVNNGDGSITLNIYSIEELWGWDIFTDPENKTFSVVLKGAPKLSEIPGKPLSGITVTVCAGHGGTDPGALSVAGEHGVNEAQINAANSLAIAENLENLGANVVLLITYDKKLDTYGRTDPARYNYSDLYICCHANSVAENSQANLWCGTYVYYHYDHSAEFAKKLCDYISAATKRDNEGSEAGYYSVTRLTMCPAVMLEVGFVSNPKEFESLIDKLDIQKTANAVVKASLEILDN